MIGEVLKGLNFETAYDLATKISDLDEIEIAAILGAIEAKGYDAEVLAGFAKGVAEKARIDLGEVADTCGTGGDGVSSINVSTAVAIALSTVHPVAKHGNRAVSSKSGSADVLESLGVNIEMNEKKARKMISETGFAFLFAPLYHKSFAKVVNVRRKLAIKTIFNIIGPLTNPANPVAQIVGVANADLVRTVGEALVILGRRGVVVHGNGLDEVSPSDKTKMAIVDGDVDILTIQPEDFGVKKTEIIPCQSSEESARRIKAVFDGNGLEEDRIFVALNFATSLFALGFEDLKENMEIFEEKLQNGDFKRKLEDIVCRSMNL